MAKCPDIVTHAKRGDLKFLEDFTKLPEQNGTEACLDADPDLFFSDFAVDVNAAKAICIGCPMLEKCAAYAIAHENYGVWGAMSAADRFAARGNQDAFDPNDVERLLKEKAFILNSPAPEVAAFYGVDPRTVVRWRNDIRAALEAS